VKISLPLSLFALFLLLILPACQASQPQATQAQQPAVTGPYAAMQSTDSGVLPASIQVGTTINQSITLQNLPSEGLTSAEFTCSYDASLVEISALTNADIFGTDALAAINGPADGKFIYAIAAVSQKASAGGKVFQFDIKAIAPGSLTLSCLVKASTGGPLSEIIFQPATVTITP
jgi:hypothetical protein